MACKPWQCIRGSSHTLAGRRRECPSNDTSMRVRCHRAQAPEVLGHQRYSTKADVYSFAMVSGHVPCWLHTVPPSMLCCCCPCFAAAQAWWLLSLYISQSAPARRLGGVLSAAEHAQHVPHVYVGVSAPQVMWECAARRIPYTGGERPRGGGGGGVAGKQALCQLGLLSTARSKAAAPKTRCSLATRKLPLV